MKILFWLEVFVSILCLAGMIYDLVVGEYVWALFQAVWTVIDTTLAIILGIEVYGG